jgi:hypothetical protein
MTPEQRAVMEQVLDVLQKGDVLCEFVACKILSAELAKPERVPEPVAKEMAAPPATNDGWCGFTYQATLRCRCGEARNHTDKPTK